MMILPEICTLKFFRLHYVFNVKDATTSIRGPLYRLISRWPDSEVTHRLTEALLLILQRVSQLSLKVKGQSEGKTTTTTIPTLFTMHQLI